MNAKTDKPLTGRKVLIIALAAFGLVIAANMTLLFSSLGSFPGLVVPNSYVASQGYDAERQAQIALGWSVAARHADGRLAVTVTDADGAPVRGLQVTATIGKPASQADDVTIGLIPDFEGYVMEAPLAPGLWRIEIEARGEAGALMRANTQIYLKRSG